MLLSLEVHWAAATRYNTCRSIENIVDIFERGGIIIFAKAFGALG
jgi:hypothetical protein